MSSLQKIESKRAKQSGRGASAKYRWQKQITLDDGRRTTIRLGALSEKAAAEISGHIDHLIETRKHNTTTSESTKAWLQCADQDLIAKLHSFGLCGLVNNPTIEAFCADFVSRKKLSIKSGTEFLIKQVEKQLVDHFGKDKRVTEVTKVDAKSHWTWLLAKGLAVNTAKRRLGRVREIFNDACELGIIHRNPFQMRSLPVAVGVGVKDYVEAATIEAVIEHLPADKVEWKLLLAFGRFVGCRMPSEIENLTWDDINWAANTILVRSPKTEHHEGKAERLVPIFPQVAKLLLSQAEVVPTGTVYVFPQLRKHTNTATTVKKMVAAAGFECWPKFWNSLRASCETDLMDEYGLRKACAWIGNSPAVAMKHYALMRKSDFLDVGGKSDAAANGPISASEKTKGLTSTKSDAKSDAVGARTGENRRELTQGNPVNTRVCGLKTTGHGLETIANSLGNDAHSVKSDAKSDASTEISDSEILDLWRRATNDQRRLAESILRGSQPFPHDANVG